MSARCLRRLSSRLGLLLVASFLVHGPARAQVFDTKLWGTNGSVKAITRVGNTLFIGGTFTSIAPSTGGGVPLSLRDGLPARGFPHVAGLVRAAAPDGHGGWFIGGSFAAVNGVPRANLAHLREDGSLAPWNPGAVGVNKRVRDMQNWFPFDLYVVNAFALRGNTLYVGGTFTSIGGKARNRIAAVDARTGEVRPWNPGASDAVSAIEPSHDGLFVGGDFVTIGAQPRSGIAQLDYATGAATAWNPGADRRVLCLAATRRTLYVGGEFDVVDGHPRSSLAAIDIATGHVTDWNANVQPARTYLWNGDWLWPWVAALAIRGDVLYAGGSFDGLGGSSRQFLAALTLGTAQATAFDPHPDGYIVTLAADDRRVIAGGDIAVIGGQARRGVAALDPRTGVATDWSAHVDGMVLDVVAADREVFVGGPFGSALPGRPHRNLAAFDANSGEPMAWNLDVDSGVNTLVASGNTVYAGGAFGQMAGQARHHLAAFDAGTGVVSPWTPGVSNVVHALGVRGDTVYIAGDFMSVDEKSRNGLAGVDAITGHATGWNPNLSFPEPSIYALAVTGNHAYIGGALYSHNPDYSEVRDYLADLDLTTARWSAWDPIGGPPYPYDVWIEALEPAGPRIYVAGHFSTTMGGLPRTGIAAVDTLTGSALAWDAQADGDVTAVAARGNTVFAGGSFRTIGGGVRGGLAALDATTAAASPWNPRPTGATAKLFLSGNTLYVGGDFRCIADHPQVGIAAFTLPPTRRTLPLTATAAEAPAPDFRIEPVTPNPVRASAVIAFTLPSAGLTHLGVYDLAGRRVAAVIDGRWLAAGPHRVDLDARGVRPGVFFVRLEHGGASANRRMVVLE